MNGFDNCLHIIHHVNMVTIYFFQAAVISCGYAIAFTIAFSRATAPPIATATTIAIAAFIVIAITIVT